MAADERNGAAQAAGARGGEAPMSGEARAYLATGRPPGFMSQRLVTLLLILAVPAVVLAAAWGTYGPDILRDLWLRGTYRPAPEYRVADNRCNRLWFAITFCRARIEPTVAGAGPTRETRYLVAFVGTQGVPQVAMRSTADPGGLALGFAAVDHLVNRVLFLVVLTLGLGAVLVSMARILAMGRYRGGRADRELRAEIDALARAGLTPPGGAKLL